MEYIIAVVIGYLIGSINPAFLIAKSKGFDIRTRGSFSAGASNAKVTMGWPYFIIVVICDVSKAIISIMIMKYAFKASYPVQLLAGVAAVYGHCLPFYLNFKGGKGFAAFIGLGVFINWKVAIIALLVGGILTLVTNWIVVMTFLFIFSVPIFMIINGAEALAVIFVFAGTLLIFVKHFVNIKKLINHKEIGVNGYYIGTKIKPEE